jgi:plastocyanin
MAATPEAETVLATRIAGSVGPGFTISVARQSVAAGQYRFVISDQSDVHNWHITDPGVNKKTRVGFVGTKRFTVSLRRGTYTIVCDPHASSMRTTLRVT